MTVYSIYSTHSVPILCTKINNILELIRAEAEDSLAEVDQPKRKQDNQKAGRKAKRRKLDLLVGWGEADGIVEETSTTEMDEPKDWMEESHPNPAFDKHTQSTLASWVVKENVPEGRIEDEEIHMQFGKSRTVGEGGCVITQTGSVGVAAPQSNIVLKNTETQSIW